MIRLEESGEKLNLWYKDHLVFAHSPEEPFLTVASCEINPGRRPYDVSKRVKDRIPLSEFRILQENRVVFFEGSKRVHVTFEEAENRLHMSFSGLPAMTQGMYLEFDNASGAPLFGGGMQPSYLELSGRNLPQWVRSKGTGRTLSNLTGWVRGAKGRVGSPVSTPYPQPTLLWDRMYVHVHTSFYSEVDCTARLRPRFFVQGVPLDVVVDVGESWQEALASEEKLLGERPSTPPWLYEGVTLLARGGSALVRERLEMALGAGIPVAAVLMDDWAEEGDWRLDRSAYGDFEELLRYLQSVGVRPLAVITPYLNEEGTAFAEARDAGYLVMKGKSPCLLELEGSRVGLVDFTHPDGLEWYQRWIFEHILEAGFAGYLIRGGEHLPLDAALHNGKNAHQYHNLWPLLWTRANRGLLKGYGEERLLLVESGFTGASAHGGPILLERQMADFSRHDGLPAQLSAMLSASLMGVEVACLAGGQALPVGSKGRKDVLLRWAELAAFSPLFFLDESDGDKDWRLDSDTETLIHVGRMGEIFGALREYRQESGDRLVHPLFLDFPKAEVWDEYLLGKDLLIAPILSKDEKRKVVLPELEKGFWIHLWTGEGRDPGAFEESAPLGFPPVYYKSETRFIRTFERIQRLGAAEVKTS
ncbi:TIM-barrel domain-containing protein [Gehongia tenuis]|uniref:Alpha-glucosidase n=1 Tax=Gehongia tenuis TaxID=2763655 RepID=A0A926D497_9FIRM|nr:TIM-barrel domain-containing protein [Gehongia tenuis]MBC8531286.1 hypothetical protein [Gehongia tenuis]